MSHEGHHKHAHKENQDEADHIGRLLLRPELKHRNLGQIGREAAGQNGPYNHGYQRYYLCHKPFRNPEDDSGKEDGEKYNIKCCHC